MGVEWIESGYNPLDSPTEPVMTRLPLPTAVVEAM
jgi:hypothetical protein